MKVLWTNSKVYTIEVKDFVVKIFKDIMAYVSKGFKNLISFLDVEPVVDVKSDVKIDV